jgi:hypothetical protein
LTSFVIAARIAVEWVVEEDGTPRASTLQAAEIELLQTRSLLEAATRIAVPGLSLEAC